MNADDGPRELSTGILRLLAEPIGKAAASPSAVAPAPSAQFARFDGPHHQRRLPCFAGGGLEGDLAKAYGQGGQPRRLFGSMHFKRDGLFDKDMFAG